MKERIQRWGGFLAGMVVPNLGAFIAWGLITAIFIPTGWIPNEQFSALVGPMILYLLPILIGYTGGKAVYGHRGGVIGAVATMGTVVGSSIPQFMGAMIAGPISAFLLKKLDEVIEPKIPIGFELPDQQLLARYPGPGYGDGLHAGDWTIRDRCQRRCRRCGAVVR